MLGLCKKLQDKTGIDRFWFRLLFIIWFIGIGGWAIIWYILLSFIID